MNTDNNNWVIRQEGYNHDNELFYESIYSLGNGYMGVRGFHEYLHDKESHELCTYIAGLFDYLKPGITDMVNTPNYLHSHIKINDERFDFNKGSINDYQRVLDLRDGTLTTSLIWEDSKNNRTKMEFIRFLSIAHIHNAVIRYKITPLNYSGTISVEMGIDATVSNNPINDDQLKKDTSTVIFLEEIEKKIFDDDISYIKLKTKESNYTVAEAFSMDIYENEKEVKCVKNFIQHSKYIGQEVSFSLLQGKEYIIDKMIAVFTSRDQLNIDIENAVKYSVNTARNFGFNKMYENNKKAWEDKWKLADIIIEGDDESQLGIRYNIFELIQSNAENDPNVSIGARGLSHGRYKGCYFWDTEIFMLPFYIYSNPNAARNLLMYRYNTLSGAEENARKQNVEGARYSWMCTIDGQEQCDTWDIGFSEVHITADVAYAINHYEKVTGDEEFIRDHGAEIYIKTARYWKSRFTYESENECYNMLFVKGPNEYGGVTQNNTFTTLMAIKNFNLAIDSIKLLKEKYPDKWAQLGQKINFKDSEIEQWQDIIDKAVINYDSKKKLYIEDDNFLKMEPLDIEKFKTDDTPVYHKICFDRLQRYMVLKQADVLLLMILLSDKFTTEEMKAAWDFYEPITLHDSTLSFGSHALIAARLGIMEKAYDYFVKSVRLDLDDIMCNTGKEGIHAAALGASWQAVVNGFGGVEIKEEELHINPNLPHQWKLLKFKILYKGQLLTVIVTDNDVSITSEDDCDITRLNIRVKNKPLTS